MPSRTGILRKTLKRQRRADFQQVCQNRKFAKFMACKGVLQISKYSIIKGNTGKFYGIQYGILYTKTNFNTMTKIGRAERMNICYIQTK